MTTLNFSLITDKHSRCAGELIKVLNECGANIPPELINWKEQSQKGGKGKRGSNFNNLSNKKPRPPQNQNQMAQR